ncbi:hypothetical protein [Sphaerisporangium siamense]|uniref:Uncharacterized protein n=1 Tax=Sphaerisporangium siamense TaxID=795645 RepID=A0A7W7D944_9ACTN|nr:hypothetical protein [Sphaerisporangium siamense]MBB4702331.1 hypothetical protein [Sphaerisporangium siamense]
MDFFGGWIAIRRHSWSADTERFGISNVLGADTLADLAVRLDEQWQAESRRKAVRAPGPRAASDVGGSVSSS